MATVHNEYPYRTISGRVKKDSLFSECVRKATGKHYSYYWDPDTVILPTPARLVHRTAIWLSTAEANAICQDAEQLAEWQQRFAAYCKQQKGPQRDLRGYIRSEQMKITKQRLQQELAEQGTINGTPIDELMAAARH